jgi:hypothetical protein
MKKLLFIFSSFALLIIIPVMRSNKAYALTPCQPATNVKFLGIPTWYEYLDGQRQTDSLSGKETCTPVISCDNKTDPSICNGQSGVDTSKIWLIGLAIIDILLRIGGFIAVGMVIFGGFKYIVSQGNPDATKNARKTIINAFAGIAITLVASVSVNFIAKLIK